MPRIQNNLFTLASKEEESKQLVGYRVGYYEEGVLQLTDFSVEELSEAERLMYEKGGWMTGIRRQNDV